jgi:hypothetical protein
MVLVPVVWGNEIANKCTQQIVYPETRPPDHSSELDFKTFAVRGAGTVIAAVGGICSAVHRTAQYEGLRCSTEPPVPQSAVPHRKVRYGDCNCGTPMFSNTLLYSALVLSIPRSAGHMTVKLHGRVGAWDCAGSRGSKRPRPRAFQQVAHLSA